MNRYIVTRLATATALIGLICFYVEIASPVDLLFRAGFRASDPGVRKGDTAGGAIKLTPSQMEFFTAGLMEFVEKDEVEEGLGPRFNLDSCGGCHAHPAIGGTSPEENPQIDVGEENDNDIPSFISRNGPVREARFVRNPDGTPDGGVHNLFTISANDAPGCSISQPDFERALAYRNVIFRIPTPLFGAGLIEAIPDSAIQANQLANTTLKRALGILGRPNIVLSGSTISGQPNTNGNDGTFARFGWKAQNKSLLLFSGEAYNVEMGISNELFQTERDETPECNVAMVPNDVFNSEGGSGIETMNGIDKFAVFMRFLAPPTPSEDTPGGADSIALGKKLFGSVGCAACHTPTLKTGNSPIEALRYQDVNLYSDLLIHDMGRRLADGVSQGQAGPREFRTAPLWGVGQRVFFLHDGRTKDLLVAIREHQSGSYRFRDASEANAVIDNYERLNEYQKQHLLNFLRSL